MAIDGALGTRGIDVHNGAQGGRQGDFTRLRVHGDLDAMALAVR